MMFAAGISIIGVVSQSMAPEIKGQLLSEAGRRKEPAV